MTQTPREEGQRFSELAIAPNLLAILEENKFFTPTPIQYQVIPPALEGKDVVGIAQTGTGKTMAFGIPMIQRLALNKGQGLILVPTRELAVQVNSVLELLGRTLKLRTAVLIGGASMYIQLQQLRHNPHIVVATPGRLADHLKQRSYSLGQIKIVVLDEADRMLDIGFLPEIRRILLATPKTRQTMLFSATMPQEIAQIAAAFMSLPLRIEVAPAGTAASNVRQEIFVVTKEEKVQLLEKVLDDHKGSVLVFSRTKHGASKITKAVRHMGHTVAEIHSNRSFPQRRAALDGFKTGKFRVLIATDIAARGIDVTGISLVVNFDLPDNLGDYVHRIGRTGRAGNSGQAISFATHQERSDIRQIERLIKKTIPILALPVLPPRRVAPVGEPRPPQSYPPRQGHGGFPRSPGGRPGGNKRFSQGRRKW
ncbi:MAG: DEAD/DEAH box helicase [Patescibacteria group bacterium]